MKRDPKICDEGQTEVQSIAPISRVYRV